MIIEKVRIFVVNKKKFLEVFKCLFNQTSKTLAQKKGNTNAEKSNLNKNCNAKRFHVEEF